MHIAVLSGKGGTGKTTVSTNLSKIMGYRYVDCDVEEPNGFIFLKPEIKKVEEVAIPIPEIDQEKCSLCKACVNACHFNALAYTKQSIMLFEQMCHGCGACMIICPTKAIHEKRRTIGKILMGYHKEIECFSGILNLGEPMAGPIISKLRQYIDNKSTIIDCAPGSSCNVVKAVIDCDYGILVTEPTVFGLHDLKIAVNLVKQMGIPHGVIINCHDPEEELVEAYCMEEHIPILGKIPFDRNIASLHSEGKLLVEDAVYRAIFQAIASKVEEVASCS
ncbi:MinD superfamily P-loop ATPase, contains an inserted ferredoxin domain [Geosporobacter subterraneus DSM 17957]|uniref:MinD superfamily P-loop ATPase, contains an inserted ferredoxin domain n=1 Tax=Geosporobacter subterraneus DSM 17957 TaxID=1121919 RepID=A0A1M6D1B2_9FIRM|nr:ATP-binding protein [Geosporobacter subterraneus]SHI67036.1 MinD superfamily P-loop ATPase, contains an inserted ferredoxin domain [Geosporobacter subterraneus DSM 17957]